MVVNLIILGHDSVFSLIRSLSGKGAVLIDNLSELSPVLSAQVIIGFLILVERGSSSHDERVKPTGHLGIFTRDINQRSLATIAGRIRKEKSPDGRVRNIAGELAVNHRDNHRGERSLTVGNVENLNFEGVSKAFELS